MRRILIDNARKKSRWKRGGKLERVNLERLELAAETPPDTLLVVQEALWSGWRDEDEPKAELVKLRFFVGLTHAEAAEVLGLSEPTVKRHWEYARAWLLREIRAILAERVRFRPQKRSGVILLPPLWRYS
jgi:RNA polymerase sigma factor (TIGR02999 family)